MEMSLLIGPFLALYIGRGRTDRRVKPTPRNLEAYLGWPHLELVFVYFQKGKGHEETHSNRRGGISAGSDRL